jgi:hypothetical protein
MGRFGAAVAALAAAHTLAAVPPGFPHHVRAVRDIVGSTHWSGCYFMDASIPFLLDGARTVAGIDTTVIKLSLSAGAPAHHHGGAGEGAGGGG